VAVVSSRNVTVLKPYQSAASERDFVALVNALPIAARLLDTHGQGRHFNPAWLRMTGRTLKDEIQRPWLECVHPDDRANCQRAYRAVFESHKPATIEYRVRCDDGRELWLLDHVVPRYDDHGRCIGFVSATVDITERRRVEERLRDLTGQLVKAEENERRRIARELHDDINQRIALLAIAIDQIGSASSDQGIRQSMRDLSMQATEISRVVHALSHQLHSSALEALGLVSAVRTLTSELAASGLRVNLIADDDYRDVPPDAALRVFRVIQEALSNVLRHSGATEAIVTLCHSSDALKVRVEDRGRGFDPARNADGLGLHTMRERLAPIGGRVQVRSRPGEGTTVEAFVPRAKSFDGGPSTNAA
jgi:PAS domain S-box-containing protein